MIDVKSDRAPHLQKHETRSDGSGFSMRSVRRRLQRGVFVALRAHFFWIRVRLAHHSRRSRQMSTAGDERTARVGATRQPATVSPRGYKYRYLWFRTVMTTVITPLIQSDLWRLRRVSF